MWKKLILIMILLIPTVYGITECSDITKLSEIPCTVTSTWNYTPPCNGYNASVYNITGNFITNFTFNDFGDTQLCYFVWNITNIGSYNYIIANGDSGNLTIIGDDNMLLSLIISILAIGFGLLIMSFKMAEEYDIIKKVMFFSSFGFFILALAIGFTTIDYTIHPSSIRIILTTSFTIILLLIMVTIFTLLKNRILGVIKYITGK